MGTAGGANGADGDSVARADADLLERTRSAPVLAGPLPHFDPEAAPAEPGPLFAEWLARALDDGVPEPQVMTLSTAGADAVPSARVLILRGIDTAACAYDFATDSRSPKSHDLAANPQAALTWYWPAHGRQIRMAGPVTLLGEDATRRDFLGRSERARAAAFAGPTSAPLDGPHAYHQALEEGHRIVSAEPSRVPATHTLHRLHAHRAEFFQADPPRFHLRLLYTRTSPSSWTRTLLWP
jgi:pyridoxamine 5'-phosphate oxidase